MAAAALAWFFARARLARAAAELEQRLRAAPSDEVPALVVESERLGKLAKAIRAIAPGVA
jgi:hypothetical protein